MIAHPPPSQLQLLKPQRFMVTRTVARRGKLVLDLNHNCSPFKDHMRQSKRPIDSVTLFFMLSHRVSMLCLQAYTLCPQVLYQALRRISPSLTQIWSSRVNTRGLHYCAAPRYNLRAIFTQSNLVNLLSRFMSVYLRHDLNQIEWQCGREHSHIPDSLT